MYVDETGGTDDATTSDDMTVTVDGVDYTTEANTDLNEDGIADTTVVQNADGTTSAYVDADQDGDADYYVEVDQSGEVVAKAEYNEATGEWEAMDASGQQTDTSTSSTETHVDSDTGSGSGTDMSATLPSGEQVNVGAPTIDTNDDGVADTSMAEDSAGNTYYFTDVDNDGAADYVVIQNTDGTVEAYKHEGGSQWTPIDTGSAAPAAAPAGVTAGGGAEGVTKIGGFSG